LRPFLDVAGRDLGPAEIELLKEIRRDIRYGAENFGKAIGDRLWSRTEKDYQVISESLYYFNEARLNLIALSRHNVDLKEVALKAAERVSGLENRAMQVERIKRPGNTAKIYA